jgi:hypothetical protein
MAKFYWDIQQGSVDWYAKRAGIPTASRFHHIMTPKKMELAESRKKYAIQLIAERLMNFQTVSLEQIDHIAEGKKNEPLAVAQLELIFNLDSKPVGFVTTNDGRFGASPDRVAGRDGCDTVIEAKCPTVPVQLERLVFGDNDAYRCQRQGQIWVAEADKAIFLSYSPRMPLYLVEDGRDEKFLAKLADCLDRFGDELDAWTAKARSLGAYQPFDPLIPVDAAYHRERLETEEELNRVIEGDW